MNFFKHWLIVAALLISVASARAEIVYLGGDTLKVVENLGTKFIYGCALVALGVVCAALVLKKR